jgi:CelD/BcsL family acetyltransferase involved in cellulose biosynthesis
VDVEVHEDGLEPLLSEWARLFAADPHATPFASPGWAEVWWSYWGYSDRPWIVVVRDQGQLVGLAAFLLRQRGSIRLLRGLGRSPGDYWDIVALPAVREYVAEAVAETLAERRDQWDVLMLDGLGSGSLSRAMSGTGLRVRKRPSRISPEIRLPDSFEDYLKDLPKSRRSNLRRHMRRLDEGELELRDVEDGELSAAIDLWHELRGRWWGERGRRLSKLHTTDRFREFNRAAVLALNSAGLAAVWEMRHAGEPVGVCFNFVDARAFYWNLNAFDPRIERLGPGKVVIGEGIRRSIAAGRETYDFMLGDEAYKYWYGATARPRLGRVVSSRSIRSRVAGFGTAARDRIRPPD